MSEAPYIPELERDLEAAAQRMATERPRRQRPQLRVPALTAMAAAAAAAVISFVVGAGSDPEATAAPVRSGGMILGDSFAIFRAPSTADLSGSPFAERRGLVTVDPATARQLEVPGYEIWAGADEHQVCISVARNVGAPGFSGACAQPAQILQSGLFASSRASRADIAAAGLPEGTTQIVGLLPDGVQSVTFSLTDGSSRTADVSTNGVAITVNSAPTALSFRDASNILHTGSL